MIIVVYGLGIFFVKKIIRAPKWHLYYLLTTMKIEVKQLDNIHSL